MLVVDIEHLTFYIRRNFISVELLLAVKRIELTAGVFGFIKS